MINFDAEVDAVGLKCPMPMLKCKKGLNQLKKGVLKSRLQTTTQKMILIFSASKRT